MISHAILPLIMAGAALASRIEPQYRVRRRVHEVERRMDEDDFILTFSDDGRTKTLEPFIIDLFETPSELQDDALPVLRMAMNKFLLEEFNAIYEPASNELESVGSEVFEVATTMKNERRSLQVTGTEVEMEVALTFDHEPSPQRTELERMILIVMADLTHFVGNLTSFQHPDWEGVTEAYRRELPTPSPTQAPVDKTDSVIDDPTGTGNNVDERNPTVRTAVPTTLVAASLIALVVFLFVQRRSRMNVETPKADDVMFVGVENDIYSVDRSLESSRSPNGMRSPELGSVEYSTSADGSAPDDSVFGGISVSPSYGQTRGGTKSLMSGFTNASASTIRASNTQPHERAKQSYSKAGGSLFAFDEGPFDEDAESEGPPEPTSSDVSEDSNRRDAAYSVAENVGNWQPRQQYTTYEKKDPPKAATPTDVLADLKVLATSRSSPAPRDPTPMALPKKVSVTNTVSYNPFNCNPVLPQGTDRSETSQDSSTRIPSNNANSPLYARATVNNSMETPLTRNTAHGVSPLSAGRVNSAKSTGSGKRRPERDSLSPGSVGMMSGLATRFIGGVYGDTEETPSEKRSRASSFDETSARVTRVPQSGTKSAPTTPKRNLTGGHWIKATRLDTTSPPPGEGDYVESLSRPSTPGDAFNRSIQENVEGYGCYPFGRMVDGEPGDDSQAGGRRHAGNTGIDGSAMYQTTAMHPLDWSYKSADIQSVGESTISENDGAAMPRQFLFAGKRESKSTSSYSQGGEPKTPMSEMSGKTGTTNRTNDSSQASASRQLINDLVWLEKKIADVRQGSHDQLAIDAVDSLSYISTDNEAIVSASSRDDSEGEPTISTGRNESVMSSIVCRDCFAPPGKLHIVIHSTKDGPAVHTVKEGSSLEGHVFPGDLIISVDNVDTRTYTAEQVMKLMASKSSQERKITVLHFEEE